MISDANTSFRRTFRFLCDVIQNTSGRCVFHAAERKMEIITNYIINVLYKFQTIDCGDKLRTSVCLCARVIFAAVIVETPAGFGGNIFFTPRRRRSLSFIYISSRAQNVYFIFISLVSHFTARNQYRTMVYSRW